MKDLLKYFKTGQLTDAEYVEKIRKSLRYSQYVKKWSWGFVIGGIAWMAFGCFVGVQVGVQADIISNASQSNLYLLGLSNGITVGSICTLFFLAGGIVTLSGSIQPILWHRNKLLVEYYDKLQIELAKPK